MGYKMLRWKTKDKNPENLDLYMDVVEAEKFFKKIEKPENDWLSNKTKYYYPYNYKRHLRSLEK